MIKNFLKDKILQNSYEKFPMIWENNNFDGNIIQKNKWHGLDDLYNFIKNKDEVIYNSDDIYYELNEYGYRTSEETNHIFQENNIACFGCSQTFGIGLPYNETWPSVLNSILGVNWSVKNYGFSGATNDTISRLIYNYTLYNTPKVICCFFPDMHRMELFNNDCMVQLNNSRSKWVTETIHESYLNIMSFEYGLYCFIKNFKFIESLCKNKNIKFYWSTWCESIFDLQQKENFNFLNKKNYVKVCDDYSFLETKPKARDNCHYGRDVNKKIALEFSHIINVDTY